MTSKSLKYWSKMWLETVGLSLGVALVIVVLQLGGSIDFSESVKEVVVAQLAMFPYYLFTVAAFVIALTCVGYCQVYFSTLVSMNATRKEAAFGILGVVAAVIGFVILITVVIWNVIPGAASSSGKKALLLFAGALFLTSALFLILAFVMVRWGKIGSIIFMMISVLIGAGAGFCAGMGVFGNLVDMIKGLLTKFDLWWTLAIGLGAYVLTGLFILVNTRKLEVRA